MSPANHLQVNSLRVDWGLIIQLNRNGQRLVRSPANSVMMRFEKSKAPQLSLSANMHKDTRLTKDLISDFKLTLEGFSHILEIYEEGMSQGLGGEDFSATYKVVKEMSCKS
jgi:3-hydroxyisobutyrate dehydrogenase-like beta-hydroxyacid dehydrogenase